MWHEVYCGTACGEKGGRLKALSSSIVIIRWSVCALRNPGPRFNDVEKYVHCLPRWFCRQCCVVPHRSCPAHSHPDSTTRFTNSPRFTIHWPGDHPTALRRDKCVWWYACMWYTQETQTCPPQPFCFVQTLILLCKELDQQLLQPSTSILLPRLKYNIVHRTLEQWRSTLLYVILICVPCFVFCYSCLQTTKFSTPLNYKLISIKIF